jgi:serine/threonine protein kinase/Tfp pilus assembly protein PilF
MPDHPDDSHVAAPAPGDRPDRTVDVRDASASKADPFAGAPGAFSASLEKPGDQIGPYKLISMLGEGGFGEVWLAERKQPFTQQVALKVIKAGMDSKAVIGRFEQERQALAVMNHPHVAKVLDGGLTPQGRPYFAMEYVKGEPITDFCDRQKLSIKDRLRLFMQVCEAIQHAHTKGIIHRDLKPGNVLVGMASDDTPQAKVIDFGVAKALTQRMTEKTVFTETGQMIGTPLYMSPEQADPTDQDIDTRSDVYSLGVILYELLAGATPFDIEDVRSRAYREVQRMIREQDPPTPSARLSTIATKDTALASKIAEARKDAAANLSRLLKTELEWIPLKAMRKERQERYDTPADLARDVQNYLEGRPLLAAPESTAYRVRKYIRRHRGFVIGSSTVLAALVLGLGLATWQWAEARAAKDQAIAARDEAIAAKEAEKERADQLKKVSDFQSQMLSQIDTTQVGIDLMADVRERFVAALGKAGVAEADRIARLDALRQELVRVNATDAAAAMIDRTILKPAIKTIDTQFKDDPATDASLRQALADLYRSIGLYDAAYPLQESALATRRRVLGEEHPDTITSINNMGFQLQAQGKLAEAEPYYRDALEKRRRTLGEEHPNTIESINNMGFLLQAQGKLAEAEPYYRDALEKRRRVLGEEHPDTITSINNRGFLLQAQGKLAEAEPYYRDALEKGRRVLGEKHPHTLRSISNMGFLLKAQGKLAEAEPYYRDALEKYRRVLGEEHPDTITSVSLVVPLDLAQSKDREALDLAEPFEPAARKAFSGGNAPRLATFLTLLGRARVGVGYDRARFALAEANLLEAHAIFLAAKNRGPSHTDTLECMQTLVDLYTAWDKAEPGNGYAAKAAEWKASLDAAKPPEPAAPAPDKK